MQRIAYLLSADKFRIMGLRNTKECLEPKIIWFGSKPGRGSVGRRFWRIVKSNAASNTTITIAFAITTIIIAIAVTTTIGRYIRHPVVAVDILHYERIRARCDFTELLERYTSIRVHSVNVVRRVRHNVDFFGNFDCSRREIAQVLTTEILIPISQACDGFHLAQHFPTRYDIIGHRILLSLRAAFSSARRRRNLYCVFLRRISDHIEYFPNVFESKTVRISVGCAGSLSRKSA
mmetsp:Transcript_58223/g.161393  ORF Transcript_58223/g.161393 Transcript_58223/m.161393 type:complete len:234 (+) Transcript_58223:868-1569(+)